ncbi:MAG: hypothetical protein DRI24_22075 [Deltaproteobacteria bacterium]|nr:MAG: hypothetical protein DRI24_22075 [Deltaproteobacteria bacterium]
MKKVFTFLTFVLLSFCLYAQSPEKLSYQAVIRDADNYLLANTDIGMQVSILQGSVTGSAVYVETHTPTTNANGLITIEIGDGSIILGSFSSIDWSDGPYFIKTETDPEGGTNYTITGTSQLLSVPFALYAKTAEEVTGILNEVDPVFGASTAAGITEGDTAYWNDKLDEEVDGDVTNELQNIYLQEDSIIVLTDGGFIVLPPEEDPVFSASVAAGITGSDTTYWNNKLDSYTETDPIFGASVAGGITATDTTNWSNHTDSTDIANMGYIAGGTYSVGDFAQGGIVFWVDETGQHGIVCAKTDQSTGVRWYAGTFGETQAKGDGPYAGEANTAIIIAAYVAIGDDGNTYAARICNELQITEGGKTYGDWYLPSKEELNLMFLNKSTIDATAGANGGNGFASAYYWSSTEYSSSNVWRHNFGSGGQFPRTKASPYYVRAIRAF